MPVLSTREDHSLGTVSRLYDTDADGRPDLEVLYQITITDLPDIVTETKPVPLLYIIDEDRDGLPDEVWIDRDGTGLCEDVKLYEDLRQSRYWTQRKGA